MPLSCPPAPLGRCQACSPISPLFPIDPLDPRHPGCAWPAPSRLLSLAPQATSARSSPSRCVPRLRPPTRLTRSNRTAQSASTASQNRRPRHSRCAPFAQPRLSPPIASSGPRATSWGQSPSLPAPPRVLLTPLLATFARDRSQLFGEDEDAAGELDDAEKQGENGARFPSSFFPHL